MTTLHERLCSCGYKFWSRCKPPKPIMHNGQPMYAFITKVPLCPKCKRPVQAVTGQTRKHYSLQELL